MINGQDVIEAWDNAELRDIHPLRQVSEEQYWSSGRAQAEMIDGEIGKYFFGEMEPASFKNLVISVLDYGCGDGRVALPLAELDLDVWVSDASPKMLDECRQNFGKNDLKYQQILSIENAEKFDVIISLAVLIHQGWSDGEAIVRKLANCLRPDKGLLILDWAESPHPVERIHWKGITTWSIEQKLEVTDSLGLQRQETELPWDVYVKGATD